MDRIREQLEKGLGELSTEELEELQGLILEQADGLAEADTTPEVVAALNELADAGEAVSSEKTTRQEQAEQAEADRAAAADRIKGLQPSDEEDAPEAEAKDEPTDEEDKDDEPVAEEDTEDAEKPEPVVASGKGRVRRMARSGSLPDPNPEAVESEQGRAVVVASGALRGVDQNKPLETKYELAKAMTETLKRMNRNSAGRGDVLLASATWEYPEDRTFTSDLDHNAEIVDNVTSQQAIVASGGVCAPVNVDYTVNTWATAERPLKEKLPSFQASRGGLRYVTPPDQSALASATSVWTEATDAEPGESTKPVLHISCGEEQLVFVDAIPTRLGFGNMQGQFAPEWVAANTDLAIAAAARVAEDNLLSHLESLSVEDVTFAKGLGASRDLIAHVQKLVSAYRWIHRISPNVRITVVFPAWICDMIKIDLARETAHNNSGPRDSLAVTHAQVEELLTNIGVNPIFHLDGQAEPESKAYPLQGWASSAIKTESAGPVYPTKTVWYFFVEGAIQFLDGGRLDLGVVRDSTLDATNDYETFVETFETLANRGFAGAVVQVVSELCGNGESTAPVSFATCA